MRNQHQRILCDGKTGLATTPPVEVKRETSVERFAALYSQHRDYIWQTVRRLGVPERYLEDVTHDVFVVVHRKLDTLDPERPARPWLLGIAVREASTFRRKASHAREHLDEPEPADCSHTPEQALVDQEARQLVARALEKLGEDRRTVFVLHELNGESAPAISAAIDVPLNTVYSRLRLARKDFTSAVRKLRGAL